MRLLKLILILVITGFSALVYDCKACDPIEPKPDIPIVVVNV